MKLCKITKFKMAMIKINRFREIARTINKMLTYFLKSFQKNQHLNLLNPLNWDSNLLLEMI
jgi:hypothetical protein